MHLPDMVSVLLRLSVLLIRRTPSSTLFPYTTLFRSEPFRPRGNSHSTAHTTTARNPAHSPAIRSHPVALIPPDRKSTRLNSSHPSISYAVFCLKKKTSWTGTPRCRRE